MMQRVHGCAWKARSQFAIMRERYKRKRKRIYLWILAHRPSCCCKAQNTVSLIKITHEYLHIDSGGWQKLPNALLTSQPERTLAGSHWSGRHFGKETLVLQHQVFQILQKHVWQHHRPSFMQARLPFSLFTSLQSLQERLLYATGMPSITSSVATKSELSAEFCKSTPRPERHLLASWSWSLSPYPARFARLSQLSEYKVAGAAGAWNEKIRFLTEMYEKISQEYLTWGKEQYKHEKGSRAADHCDSFWDNVNRSPLKPGTSSFAARRRAPNLIAICRLRNLVSTAGGEVPGCLLPNLSATADSLWLATSILSGVRLLGSLFATFVRPRKSPTALACTHSQNSTMYFWQHCFDPRERFDGQLKRFLLVGICMRLTIGLSLEHP